MYDSKTFYIQPGNMPLLPPDLAYENSMAFSSTTYESTFMSEPGFRRTNQKAKKFEVGDEEDDGDDEGDEPLLLRSTVEALLPDLLERYVNVPEGWCEPR